MLVTTRSYILNTFGLYFKDSKKTVTNILIITLERRTQYQGMVETKWRYDFDRGFRDCLKFLKEISLVPEMHEFQISNNSF